MSSILSQLYQTFLALERCRYYKEKLKKNNTTELLYLKKHSVVLNIKYLKR